MRAYAAALGMMAVVGAGAMSAPARAQEDAASASQALYEKLDGLVDKIGNNKGACTIDQVKEMQSGIDNKLFATIDSPMRAKVLTVALFCAVNDPDPKRSDPEGAAAMARQLEPIAQLPEEVGMADMVLFFYGLDKGKVDAPRLTNLLTVWPEGLAGMSYQELQHVLQTAIDKDPKAAKDVFKAILAAPWDAPDIKQAVNNDWAVDYAYLLADDKDMAGVRAALVRTDDPADLIQIAGDRRFEPLWDEMDGRGRFNWEIHGKATLDDALSAAVENPDSLGVAMTLMNAFYREDRFAEAMPLGAMWRARIKSGAQIDEREDADDFLDTYAAVLVAAGKVDEAGKVFADAATVGDDKVTHATHWGQAQLSQGQVDAALKTLKAIDRSKASPFGALAIDAGIACAEVKDHPADAEALVAKMEPNWKDNSSALEAALICLNRTDAAADLYIKRFADKDERTSALGAVRTGPLPKEATAFDLEMDKRKQAILAMPKVAEALNAVGRRVEAPVQLSSIGTL